MNRQQGGAPGRVTAQIAQVEFVVGAKEIRLRLQRVELGHIGAFQKPARRGQGSRHDRRIVL